MQMMPGGGQQQRTEEEEEEGLEIVQPPVETTNGGSPGNSEQVEEKAREEQGNQNNEEGSTVTNPDVSQTSVFVCMCVIVTLFLACSASGEDRKGWEEVHQTSILLCSAHSSGIVGLQRAETNT